MNSPPFSITLNLLIVGEASDSESVVESLLETFDDEEGDFRFLFRSERFFFLLFFSISLDLEIEDVLSLLFLHVFFCLSFSLLEKVLHLLLCLQPSQLPLQVSPQLHHFLSALSHYLSSLQGE